MRNKLFYILYLLLLVSCGRNDSMKENVVRSYYDNGNVKSELRYKDGKLNGECMWYYQNGKPQMKINYINDTLNGETVSWYENGNMQSRYNVRDDQYEGLFETFNVYGVLIKAEHYKEGVLHGTLKQWYDSGKIFVEGGYNKGMFHGKWITYYENGVVGSLAEFDNGSGIQRGFAPDGQTLITEINYKNNVKDGEEKRYNTDGSITEILIWSDGEFVETCVKK